MWNPFCLLYTPAKVSLPKFAWESVSAIADIVVLERSQKALLPPLLGERKLDVEDAKSEGEL